LVPENADFGRVGRGAAKNTTLLEAISGVPAFRASLIAQVKAYPTCAPSRAGFVQSVPGGIVVISAMRLRA